MQLPPDLRNRIEALIADVPPAALARAAETLSAHYRDHQPTAALRLTAEEWTAAYLATRLPATYAAAHRVFHELADHAAPASLLDLGAGCGAAALAARAVWPNLSTLTLIEHDRSMLRAGQALLPHASWLRDDLRTALFPEHDLVVACYALNELPAAQRDAVLLRAWHAARVALVLIEPGSCPGFDGIREARHSLLSQGAHLAAPCPSASPCPMAAPDWCHFAARVERTALHRRLKHGSLSYEDEKFSFVAFTRAPTERPPARILRRPEHHPGLIELTLCHGDRLSRERVTKRHREAFRAARHAAWGDPWRRVH